MHRSGVFYVAIGVLVTGLIVVVVLQKRYYEKEIAGLRGELVDLRGRAQANRAPLEVAVAHGKSEPELVPVAGGAALLEAPMTTPPSSTAPSAGVQGKAPAANLAQSSDYKNSQLQRQKTAIGMNYGPFFAQHAVDHALRDELIDLLAKRQRVAFEVSGVTQGTISAGPDGNKSEVDRVISERRADVEAAIGVLIGADKLSALTHYEKTLPQRNTVNQLVQTLSLTSAPLAAERVDELIEIMMANREQATGKNGVQGNALLAQNNGPAGVVMYAPISDAALASAATVLTPPQLDAFRLMQNEQRVRRAMAQKKQSPPPKK